MIMRTLIGKLSIKTNYIYKGYPIYSFVLFNMFKKKLKQKQQKFKAQPQTYSAQKNSQQKVQQQKQEIQQANYDFFSRQREIDLNKDFRKIRQQTQNIPKDIGKGGFEQIVYWSEFAKTSQQIIDLVRIFNRMPIPQQISDKFRLQEFENNVIKNVYLSTSIADLQQFATFGGKFDIRDPNFWKKIEEKTIRYNVKTLQQAKDCIQIAFVMSKVGQGQLIYSSLATLFKDIQITQQDAAKLLLIYSNTESGDKIWVETLMKKIVDNIEQIKKQIIIQLLAVFKNMKAIPTNIQNKLFQRLEYFIPQYTFKDTCIVGGFLKHGSMAQTFWKKLQNRVIQTYPKKTLYHHVLFLTQLLSSYSLSIQFVRQYYIPLLRQDNYKYLQILSPQILSSISKTLYIYELENETKDIEQMIQTRIMKIFNNLKNVQVQSLIKVLKDYTVTRIGSRQLYIFLQQVADAVFQQIRQNKQHLETLEALYQHSSLCSPDFLQKIQMYL